MTVVEKAAYLKGLAEGLGVEPDSREGKLWAALTDLLSDMAHEIEDLQAADLDFADALDEMSEDLTYLEELTCQLDVPSDMEEMSSCPSCCGSCYSDEYDDDIGAPVALEDGDEELEYDGVIYDVTCPVCGQELSFDEDTLNQGSIQCPGCGEQLEFDLEDEEDEHE